MPVVSVNIKSREPYANGKSFGDSGAYERIEGVLTYSVDPKNAANTSVVDLEYASGRWGGSRPVRIRFHVDRADFCGAWQRAVDR